MTHGGHSEADGLRRSSAADHLETRSAVASGKVSNMDQATSEFRKATWKFTILLVGWVWLAYALATEAYFAGRSDCREWWNFPHELFGFYLLGMGLWFGSFLLALHGWVKVAVALWVGTAAFWCIIWIGTIAG